MAPPGRPSKAELQDKLASLRARLSSKPLPRVPGAGSRDKGWASRPGPTGDREARGSSDLPPFPPELAARTDRDAGDPQLVEVLRQLCKTLRAKDSTDEEREESPGRGLFRDASSRACSTMADRARRSPGQLLAEALTSMQRFLGTREGAMASETPRVLTYLETVFNQRFSRESVGIRTSREMRTIAEALDALIAGNGTRTGDLLIQRFKALEASVVEGSWATARHHELIPEDGVGIASIAEKTLTTRLEAERRKLQEGRSRP